jgi:hypothetical protein
MKSFLSNNWYKLMIGLSSIMFSFGFMIQSISPSFSNSNLDKPVIEIQDAIGQTNGQGFKDGLVFVDGGTAYLFTGIDAADFEKDDKWDTHKIR